MTRDELIDHLQIENIQLKRDLLAKFCEHIPSTTPVYFFGCKVGQETDECKFCGVKIEKVEIFKEKK